MGKYSPSHILAVIMYNNTGLTRWIDDKTYLKTLYKGFFGKKLNLDNPSTFNEKLQWLKLFDRQERYTSLVDKYEVKQIVADLIGQEYLIPTIGVWDNFDEINFRFLPDQFVLKCTHDSGGLVICKDKAALDVDAARRKIDKCLKSNYYWRGREWPYKNVKPRIIAEEYMEDDTTNDLRDYKFFSFNGVPKALFIATDRQDTKTDTKFDFFDMDYKHLPFTNGHPNADIIPEKPKHFELMKKLASKLSKGIPQVRVDFYEVNGKVYFGELTLSHCSGFVPFNPEEWDTTFGSWIELPKK